MGVTTRCVKSLDKNSTIVPMTYCWVLDGSTACQYVVEEVRSEETAFSVIG
jgi:hypothetical protein